LIGSGDIQSLADLANSFDVVRNMRLVPFGMQAVLHCAGPFSRTSRWMKVLRR